MATGIRARDIDFELDVARIADWNARDVSRTTLWNAFSIMFPHGERFFIECVAAYRDAIDDPALRVEVRGFVAQEALHTREHLAYNAALQSYVDAHTLDREVAERLAKIESELPRLGRLAVTCALEHFTAIMAHQVLKDEAYFAGAEASYARLWTWHALEECEHKAVAFDVFSRVARGNRYPIRTTTMLLATTTFIGYTTKHIVKIMQSVAPTQSWRAWAALLSYIFIRPGLARRIIIPYLKYYAPGFHPQQIDDRRVVASARTRVEGWGR